MREAAVGASRREQSLAEELEAVRAELREKTLEAGRLTVALSEKRSELNDFGGKLEEIQTAKLEVARVLRDTKGQLATASEQLAVVRKEAEDLRSSLGGKFSRLRACVLFDSCL